MIVRFRFIALAALLLSACGPAERASIEPIPTIELPAAGTFSVTVTGAVDAEFSALGFSRLDPAVGRAIYLTGERYSANLVLPLDQAVGTYEIVPLLDAFNPAQKVVSIGGVLVDSEPPGGGSAVGAGTTVTLPIHVFGNVSVGRVTLLSIEPLSGAFEFTADDDSGARVTVRAVFSDLTALENTP